MTLEQFLDDEMSARVAEDQGYEYVGYSWVRMTPGGPPNFRPANAPFVYAPYIEEKKKLEGWTETLMKVLGMPIGEDVFYPFSELDRIATAGWEIKLFTAWCVSTGTEPK